MENENRDLLETLKELQDDLQEARKDLSGLLEAIKAEPPDDPEEKRILDEETDALREEISFLEQDITDIESDLRE